MKILEVTPKGNYLYEGKKPVMDWFWRYSKLLKISGINPSMASFWAGLPPKIKKQIKRRKSPKLDNGLKLKFVAIDEVAPQH